MSAGHVAARPALHRPAVPRAAEAPRRPLSLRRNFLWTLSGNAAYALCQWATVLVLAKRGSPEMVGQYALGLAVTAPIVLLANLHLRGLQATDVRREYCFADYFALRLATTAAALAIVAAVGLAYRVEVFLAILAVGLAKGVESISDLLFGFFQQRERMDRIALSMTVKGALGLAAFGVTAATTRSIAWAALAGAATSAGVLLTLELPAARRELRRLDGPAARFRPRFDRPTLGRLFRLTLPLGAATFLVSLNVNVPRYFLESAWGERELGVFAAMWHLAAAGNQIATALGQAASPRLARHWAQGERAAFRRLLLRLVAVAAAAGAVAVLVAAVAGGPILARLYRAEYAKCPLAFVVVMLAGGVTWVAVMLGFSATASRRIGGQPVVLALIVPATVAASALLVPAWGLLGASVAAAIGAVLHVAGYVVLLYVRRAPRGVAP